MRELEEDSIWQKDPLITNFIHFRFIMSKKQLFLCVLPFSGFYNSSHDEAIDNQEEQMFSFDDGEVHDSLYQHYWKHMDHGNLYEKYAGSYVEAISDLTKLELEFDKLSSPREYNFTTDRIFASISRKSLAEVMRAVRGERLKKMAKRMFTSRSGFISYYSPDVSEWGRVEDWDHNQILCALEAYFEHLNHGSSMLLEDQALDRICEGGALDELIYSSAPAESRRALSIFEYLRMRKERNPMVAA